MLRTMEVQQPGTTKVVTVDIVAGKEVSTVALQCVQHIVFIASVTAYELVRCFFRNESPHDLKPDNSRQLAPPKTLLL